MNMIKKGTKNFTPLHIQGFKGWGGGGGGFENCAYLWKNSGYAPELFFQDNPRLTKQFHHMQLTGALFFTYSSPLKYCTL